MLFVDLTRYKTFAIGLTVAYTELVGYVNVLRFWAFLISVVSCKYIEDSLVMPDQIRMRKHLTAGKYTYRL